MSEENQEYTEVTSTGWTERLGSSLKGIITGLLLIIAASVLLYWNEGRSVRSAGAIAEAELLTVDLPQIETIDPSFNGKLVYAKGFAKTTDSLTDPVFGVTVTAIGLERKVRYYQWVEKSSTKTEKKLGGSEEKTTTYTYEQNWVASPVNSNNFKRSETHVNTVLFTMPVKNERWLAKNVSFGAYILPEFFISSISNKQPVELALTDQQREVLNDKLTPLPAEQTPYMEYLPTTPVLNEPQQKRVHVQSNQIYLGQNPAMPQIGDVMVTFEKTIDTNISLVAKVNNNTFEPFIAANGTRFTKLSNQQASKEIMFQDAKDSNSMMTWILRIVGIFIAVAGFNMIFAPLVVLADVLPLLGSLVGMGTGLIAGLLGTAWAFIIIAVAWIRFRPILAFSLLGIAAVLIAFMLWKSYTSKTVEE